MATEATGIVVGVDPGASTGIVVVATGINGSLAYLDRRTIEVPATTRALNPRTLQYRTRLSAEREHYRLLMVYLHECKPDMVVVEEPWDISDGWGAGGRRRGTSFRLGAAYTRAMIAVPGTASVVSYPVVGNKSEPGWMGRKERTETRRLILGGVWRGVKGAPKWDALTEHEQSAFGVLHWHLVGDRSASGKTEFGRLRTKG